MKFQYQDILTEERELLDRLAEISKDVEYQENISDVEYINHQEYEADEAIIDQYSGEVITE